jgi:hypothetical protein
VAGTQLYKARHYMLKGNVRPDLNLKPDHYEREDNGRDR